MSVNRNFFLIKWFVCLMLLVQTTRSEEKKDEDKKDEAAGLMCNQDIMRSYLLKGRSLSKPDKMINCPLIKDNCCGKLDQQRIFHIVADILPQRLVEYESKMKMALGKLKGLHETVIEKKPLFIGSPKRKLFCGQETRKLVNFQFVKLYQKIITELENLRFDMDEYYNTFFCVLCDAKNHKFIELKTNKLILNADFCKNILKNNINAVKLLYVELMNYLQNLQNVVDCHHYLKSFNLKFFESSKLKLSQDLGECLNNVTSKNFLKTCKTTCERLQISKINYLIEGDFEFLIDAANLFEKFFDFKESGSFISMKLRMFFKKFTIPRKLDKEKKKEFIEELKNEEEQNQGEGTSDQRQLRQMESHKTVKNTLKEKVTHLSNGRLLAEEGGDDKKNKKEDKKPKYARLVYNKELFHFYNEITISPPKEKEYVYHVAPKPIDIDHLTKVFVVDDGINPLDYAGTTKFKIPHDLFYKQLFTFRKPDAPDANLLFFLSDFTEKNKKLMKENLDAKFRMEPAKEPKKKEKKERILEDGTDDVEELNKQLH